MAELSISEARDSLADIINRVVYQGERVILRRHGKAVAAPVSASDLERLAALENRRPRRRGSVLRTSDAPGALPGGMAPRAAATSLISRTGPKKRGAPLHARACPRAVNVAVIAITADADRLPAAPAAILPVRLLAHRAPRSTQLLDKAVRCVHKK